MEIVFDDDIETKKELSNKGSFKKRENILIGNSSSNKVEEIVFVDPDDYYLYGSHVPFEKVLFNSLKWGSNIGLKNIQIYLGAQQRYEPSRLTEKDLSDSKKFIEEHDMKCFIHAPLVYNMAGSETHKKLSYCGDCDCKYCPDDEQLKRNSKIKHGLEVELAVAGRVNKPGQGGVVVHPGTFTNRKEGLKAISRFIDDIDFPPNSLLLLENSSGSKKGSKLAENIDELKFLIESTRNREHVGVCLDTAHLYGAGYYNMGKSDDIDSMLCEFDAKIGLNKLKLFHLNDSSAKWDSKIDAHEFIGQGHIWGNDNIEPLLHLFDCSKKYQIPMCLETSPMDIHTVMSLSSMIRDP